MYSSISPVYRSLSLVAMCLLLMISFSACSGSSSGGAEQQSGGNPGDPGVIMAPGTGGVSFQLVWQQPSSGAKAAQFTPSFNSCVDYGIDTIAATVSNGTTTITNSWPCSLHGGLLVGVPAGSSYTVQVNGMSSGPTTTIWSGQASSITVITGQITNAGTLTMSYVGLDSVQPSITVSATGPHSNHAITTNVPATDRIDIAFSEAMAISTITTNNITLTVSSIPVSGTIRYNPANNTAAFTPSANLAYDTEYVLQVISCVSGTCIRDTAGNQLASDYTNTFTIESTPLAVPGAPSSVTATPGNAQVTLDWLASNGSTSYNVYYGLSSGNTNSLISDVRPPYVHLGRTNNTAYYYVVTAVNGFGESSVSSEVNATPTFPAGTTASLTVGPSGSYNTLSWPDVAGAISYNVYWSTSTIIPNKYSADNVIRGVTSPYTHTGLTDGVTYCYIVTAINSSGESADSMQSCVGIGSIQLYW